MAFITRKKVGNKKYLQVVENYRQDGKHHQRVLRHIGSYASLEHALVGWQYQAENLSWAWDIPLADRQRNMEHHAQKVDDLRHFLASHKIEVDEAELERLRDMLPGRRESENRERISVG